MKSTAATIFILLTLFQLTSAAAESIGKAISLEGEVKILRAGSTASAQPGEKLMLQDVITTGKRSSARFLLNDSSIIDLKENSRFTFEKLDAGSATREAEFSLDFGKIRASVNKKIESDRQYKIKTKATVFAVRGTDFAIANNEKDTKLTVFEGNVQGSGDGVDEAVKAGSELALSAGLFKVTELSKAEIDSVFATSRAEDMTFFQNVVVGDFRVSRNFGSATIGTLSRLAGAPSVQIPQSAFKVPGVNPLNANAVSPGILNYVITNIGVQIQ